jgi:hypothetical protein
MATFGIKVFKHHEKRDGTFNVKIRITHDRKTAYIDTNHYVTQKMLSKGYRVKDTIILKDLYGTMEIYRDAISRLGSKVDYMNIDDIRSFLEKRSEKVDFLAFCQQHIDTLIASGRLKTAIGFKTVRYAVIDFIGKTELAAEELTPHFLVSFERFLRLPRQIKRINQFGKVVITQSAGSSDAGVHNYMHDFRTLFNAAQAHFNRPSLGIMTIPFSPFKEYKLPELAETRKRNLTVEQFLKFLQFQPPATGRVRLAYDLFLLSFYMCGMNAVDLFNCGFQVNKGRLEYQRSKTKGKRKDRAFISINVPDPALELVEKYKDRLHKDYTEIGNLNKALNKGLKIIGQAVGVSDLSFYWARHTFGNLARNKCRKSKDDVALALNHVDHGRRTTDIYLEKDWSIVDEVQEAVIALFVAPKTKTSPFNFSRILNNISLPGLTADAKQVMSEESLNPNLSPALDADENRKGMRLISA